MKKFLSAFLVLVLLFTCVACGKTDSANTDSTITTESTTQNKTESTTNHTTDGETTTESVSEEESTTKSPSKEETTKKNDTSTTNKNESTAKKTETTTKKAETTTKKPSANTTTKPSTSKPYFVSMELVSVDRYSKLYVNGVHVLDKIYGKNTYFQKGDVITYKINMSDGGKSGFKLAYAGWNCDASIKDNLLIMKITGSEGYAEAYITVNTKNGTKNISERVNIYEDTENLNNFLSQELLIREYAKVKGFKLLNGCDEENYKRYVVKIPGNNNWFSEAFASIDEAKRLGYTRYCYQLVPQDAFDMMVYK